MRQSSRDLLHWLAEDETRRVWAWDDEYEDHRLRGASPVGSDGSLSRSKSGKPRSVTAALDELIERRLVRYEGRNRWVISQRGRESLKHEGALHA